MNKHKVLIVDDELSIREFLAQVLSSNYQVLFAKTGQEAIQAAREQQPTVIILDVLMPGRNGIETCRDLRTDSQTKSIPILMLTALNEPEQRTVAFLSGADDYITKPFNPEELLARVESKIRRLTENQVQYSEQVEFGDVRLNFQDLKVEIAGTPVEVGQIEFKISNCLIKNKGQLVNRSALHAYVWGDESPSDRALDPHITTLRKKLKSSRGELKTVYGHGYSLVLKERAT